MLHGQGDVVGGDGEEVLQLGVCTQVASVGLQEGPQSTAAHVLHDQNIRLCTEFICHTQRKRPEALQGFIFLHLFSYNQELWRWQQVLGAISSV